MLESIDYVRLLIVIAVLWFVQLFFALRQNQAIAKEISRIRQSQQGTLGVSVQKSRFGLGRGLILLLVVNPNQRISEFRVMSGYSSFTRFKTIEDLLGLSLDEAHGYLLGTDRLLEKAFEEARQRIIAEQERITT